MAACGCGQTKNPNGNCDGTHTTIKKDEGMERSTYPLLTHTEGRSDKDLPFLNHENPPILVGNI